MEKIFGPFNGYVAVVCVREVSGFENKFAASYELWRGAPAVDDANARPVRQKSVAGLSESVEEAVDIALQLARLHINGLSVRGDCLVTPHVDAKPSLAQLPKSWEAGPQGDFMIYQPTMACPLQASGQRLNPSRRHRPVIRGPRCARHAGRRDSDPRMTGPNVARLSGCADQTRVEASRGEPCESIRKESLRLGKFPRAV